jgi:hypothetical protein
MTSSKVLGEITKVLQSNEEIPLDQSFMIDIIGVKAPTGSGKSLKVLDYSKDTHIKKSIITIRNKDNLCCGRALAVGKAIADNHPKVKQFKTSGSIQKKVAVELFRKANILPGPCGLREISKFQGALPGYQIIVIDFHARNASIYEGPRGEKKIVLYKNGDHYNVINPKKLPAFHGKRFFCKKCKSFYSNYSSHPCENPCHTCLRKECLLVSEEKRTCSDCFKICRSAACFNHHKKSRKSKGVDLPSKCDSSFKCQTCLATVERKRQDEHRCGEYVCHVCKEFVLSGHLCYMQVESAKEANDKLIFYDFETDFSSGEHVVNFAVAQYGDGTEFVFKGYDALHEFCEFLFSMKHKGFTAIAHNAKGFDAVLIQRWLIQNRPTADMHVIHSGQKIMQLTLNDYKIRLVDSLNFLQMPLSKFPETFGLDLSTHSKGDFPFKFNTFENQTYIGPMPAIHFYDPDTKKDKTNRDKFIAWHKKLVEEKYVFDFQKEMYKYCAQDVSILRLCCLDFRKTFLSETGVDPFCYCTIAASVMAVYRSKYLKEKTIGVIPKNLYRNGKKPYSKSSIEWLEFISVQTKTKIQHADHGGERVISDVDLGKTYHVDGFCEQTNTVYEFYGCVYHGCPLCFDGANDHPFHSERKMCDVYEATIEREKRLQALGFTVKSIWEHDYRTLRETDEMKLFLDTFDIVTDLDPRDSFFGGRVGGYKLFREAKADEKIEYVDFTSLYPFVNKTKKYPTGHPTIIRENFQAISNYFGLIKCKVLAPANLYHPVLPVRAKGKLFFPLCKQCVMDNSSDCRHFEEERSFWGTFTTIEVIKAIEKGYKVLEIREVWHFEKTSSDLFSEYVNYFLRLKQESSGFPDWVETREDQAKYIDEYCRHEGILLREDKIVENPGLRAFAKLCLNSLWGRFAMRTDRVMTEFITDPLQFYKRINGADTEMHDLCLLNDDLVEVVFKRKLEYAEESKVTNLFIGIFTTAWARLELYNLIDLLGDSVLYVDTDSCVYVSKPGAPKPAIGDFLGDLTNEITPKNGQGAYITQFLCGGPKNYAYKVNNGKTHCKIRGFTLNYKNSLVLNFDSLKDIISKYVNEPLRKTKKTRKNKSNANSVSIVNECKISREKWTRRIVSKREVKKYQVVFDKRIILGKGEDTIPYGFNWFPSTNETVLPTSIIAVPESLLYTLIHPSETVGQQSTGMNLMAHDEPMVNVEDDDEVMSDDDEMMGDGGEMMDTNERDIDLMETDNESDNDFESEQDSDIEFMNNEYLSEEEEGLSFYRRLDNNF